HHASSVFQLVNLNSQPLLHNNSYFDFRSADYSRLNIGLSNFDWKELFANTKINDDVTSFYGVLCNCIKSNIPKKIVQSRTYPSCYTKELKSLLLSKKIAHRTWKEFHLLSDFIKFKQLRSKCIKLSRNCYKI
ncbi:hypothetical protein, partial [Enterobacter cloacae complex sp. 4DZ3-17B2]|uniref:hypothetical protein n=1 Tax=Enterobacter cloacae complex sp. 4DZ3-17B2 TaxID=2511990 RepID=UPI001CA575B0